MSIEKLHFQLTADSSNFEKSMKKVQSDISGLNKALATAINSKRLSESFSLKEVETSLSNFHKKLEANKIDVNTLFKDENWSQSNFMKMMNVAKKEYDELKKITGGKDNALGLAKDYSLYTEALTSQKALLSGLKKEETDRKKIAEETAAANKKQVEQKRAARLEEQELRKAAAARAKEEKEALAARNREFKKQQAVSAISNVPNTGSSAITATLASAQKDLQKIDKTFQKALSVSFGPSINEITSFRNKIKELGFSIDDLDSSTSKVSKQNLGRVATDARDEFVALKNVVGGTNQAVVEIVREFEKYSQISTQAKLTTIQQSSAFKELTSSIQSTESKLAVFDAAASNFNKWEQGIGQINQLSSNMWVMSMGLKQFSQAMMFNLTLPLVGAGTAAAKFSMDFEQSMAQIQAASGIPKESGEAFQKYLGDNIKSLSLLLPVATEKLNEYAFAAAQAGVGDDESTIEGKTDAIVRFTATIAKLSAIEKDYTGGATAMSEVLAKAMIAYNISNDYVENVGSAIHEASAATTGGLADISSGLNRASAGAGTFNISLSETLGLLKTLLPTAGSAARAGTQLSNIYSQMALNLSKSLSGSKNVSSELVEVMGLSAREIEEQLNTNASDFFVNLIEKFASYEGAVDKTILLTEIFGRDTRKVVEQIINQHDRLRKNIENSNEALENGTLLQESYSVVADTFASTIQRAKNAFRLLGIEIGETLNEAIGGVIDKLIDITTIALSFWKALNSGTQKGIILFGLLLAAIGPIAFMFEKIFVAPIAGIVTLTAKLGGVIITTGLLERAAIRAGIAQNFLSGAMAKTSVVAGGQGVAGLLKMSSAAGGLRGIISALIPILTRLGAVGVAVGAVLGTAFAAFQTNIFGIKDKLGGLFDGLKINKFTDELQNKLSINQILDPDAQKILEGDLEKIKKTTGGAGEELIRIFGSWGDAFVEKYIKKFSEVDSQTFASSMDIAKQAFEEQRKLGQLTEVQVYELSQSARRLIAQAILDVKKLGDVRSSTESSLVKIIGSSRTESIIKAIEKAVQVNEMQDALDGLSGRLEKLQDAMSDAVGQIQDKIDAANKQFKIDTKPLESAIKAYEKEIKRLTKARNEELKPLEEQQKQQEKALKDAQREYDAIRKQNDAALDIHEKQKKIEEKNLKEQQKILDELIKLQQEELSVAEGMVKYQEMNFDAAKDQLSLETAMGRDEFDISFRAAKARAEQAQQQVDLARNQAARIEYAYGTQIDAQQTIVDTQEEVVESIRDYIDGLKDQFEAIEEVYEAQVDLANENLTATRDAIDEIKERWGELIDPLEELRDTEKERLDEMKDAHDEYVSLLEEEKSAVEERYNAEIEVEEKKLAAAEKSLESAKKSLDEINRINAELSALEAERIGTMSDASKGGGGSSEIEEDFDTDENLSINTSEVDANMDGNLKKITNKVSGWWSGFTTMWSENMSFLYEIFSEKLDPLLDAWTTLTNAISTITSFWLNNMKESVSVSLEIMKENLSKGFEVIALIFSGLWKTIKESFITFGQGLFEIFTGTVQILSGVMNGFISLFTGNWNQLKEDSIAIATGLWNIIKGLFITNVSTIITTIKTFVEVVFGWFQWLYDKLVGHSVIPDMINEIKAWFNKIPGMITTLVNAFKEIPNKIEDALSGLGDIIFDAFKEGFNKLKKNGKDFLKGFGSGVEEALEKVGFHFAAGGIVPGNYSQAVPITAHGSEMILNPSQQKELWNMITGKNSLSGSQQQQLTQNFNFNPGMMIASKGEMRAFARAFIEYVNIENSRTTQ